MALNLVEIEYVKLLEPELKAAIEGGEPDRAASFAKELARLRRKVLRQEQRQKSEPIHHSSLQGASND